MEQFKPELNQMACCELLGQWGVIFSTCAFDLKAIARGLNRVRIKHIKISAEGQSSTILLLSFIRKRGTFIRKYFAYVIENPRQFLNVGQVSFRFWHRRIHKNVWLRRMSMNIQKHLKATNIIFWKLLF